MKMFDWLRRKKNRKERDIIADAVAYKKSRETEEKWFADKVRVAHGKLNGKPIKLEKRFILVLAVPDDLWAWVVKVSIDGVEETKEFDSADILSNYLDTLKDERQADSYFERLKKKYNLKEKK